jgi:hypothetical protein
MKADTMNSCRGDGAGPLQGLNFGGVSCRVNSIFTPHSSKRALPADPAGGRVLRGVLYFSMQPIKVQVIRENTEI